MNLSRMKNDRKLYLCRIYFRGGFVFLPFLWAVNFFWFFREAFKAPPYEEQAQIKRYVIQSAVGALVWVIGLAIWVIIFQTHRAEWGELGDDLSFTIPQGRA